MKNFYILLSLAAVAALHAAEPMVPSSMSTDRGGTKSAIDAYSDGAGVNLYNYDNRSVVDNSAMNQLVFKYGEAAKIDSVTIQNEVKTLAPSTAEEKVLADQLSAIASPIGASDVKTGSCDDGNAQTIDDKYVLGICVGTNVEGKTCDDYNVKTINDVYHNGVCAGDNVEGQTCDDKDSTTVNDKYVNGICVGTASTLSKLDIFNDGSCKALFAFENDISYGSGTGTYVNTSHTYAAGKFGQSVSLTNSGINTTGTASLMPTAGNYSISAWIKRSAAKRDVIATTNNSMTPYGDTFWIDTDNKITMYFAYNTSQLAVYPTAALSVNDNIWHHVVVTVDRTNQVAKAYFDGNLVPWSGPWNQYGGTPYVPKTSAGGMGYVMIGKFGNANYNGNFDQIRFFNKPLSASEVQSLYNEQ